MINNRERRINRIKMQKFLSRRIRDGIRFYGSYLDSGNGAKCVIGCIFPEEVLVALSGSYHNYEFIGNKNMVKKLSELGISHEETLGYTTDELGKIQIIYDLGDYKKCLEYLNSLPIEVN